MAIYIKFGDEIKGEASDSEHKDFCDVQSVDFGVSQPVSAMGTGGRSSGRSEASPCTVTMVADKAYPDLYHHCATGKHIVGKVEMHQVQDTGEKVVYEKVLFTECMISTCQLSTSGSERPYVTLTFVYDEIDITHTPVSDKGEAGTAVNKKFNYKENK